VLAKTVCNYVEAGRTPQKAVEEAVALVNRRIAGGYNAMGLFAVDFHGRIGAAISSPNFAGRT